MRILIADDHELLRDTLVLFLESSGGFETVAVADFSAACDAVRTQPRFDLILLDYNMPGMNRLDGLKTALQLRGGQRVALISGEATQTIATQALDLGAAGFVPKSLSARSFVSAVKFMVMGEKYVPLAFLQAEEPEIADPRITQLTPRERQVLERLVDGKSNKEIARDLDLQEPTVKLHLKTLFRKLGVNNRTQAALVGREAGLQ